MKRLISLLIIGLIFIVGCSTNTDSSSSETEEKASTKLMQGSWFPPADSIVEQVNMWEGLVEEKTNGEVTVESFHGSQLGQSQTVYPDLIGGVYDIGWISPILFDDTEMFPYTIANLPFAFADAQSGANIMNKFFDKYNDITEVKPLGITTSDPYIIMSKDPIYNIDDVKGKRLRAASAEQIELVKSWGAIPVPIELTDIYEGLEKGTIDGVIFALSGGAGYNILEVAPNVTYLPVSSIALIPAMNKDSFNELSEPSQKSFEDELGPKFAEMYTEDNVSKVDKIIENVKNSGEGEFITLSDEELKPFQASVEKIWDNWAEEANKKGFPGDDMINDFKIFIEEEGISLPF